MKQVLCLILALILLAAVAPATAETLSATEITQRAVLDLPGGEARVVDAALLPDGTVLAVGDVPLEGTDGARGWAMQIDPDTGEILWECEGAATEPGDPGAPYYAYTAAAALADSFALSSTNGALSHIEVHSIDKDTAMGTFLDGS